MKFRMLVIILALTVVSWAQTATQNSSNATPKQNAAATLPSDTKAQCPCCQKMEGKDAASCCAHHETANKDKTEAMSCCAGKDAKCDMKNDKSVDASSAKGKCCSGAGKDCCAASEKNTEQTAMACCSGSQCGMEHHHDGQGMNK